LSFSCSQCDDRRDGMLRRGGMSKSAGVLSSLQKKKQCQREKRGFSLVKVRVIIGWKEEGPRNMPALFPKKRDEAVECKSDMSKKRDKLKEAKQAKSALMKRTLLEQKESNAAAVKQALLQKQAFEERRKSAIECMEGGKQLAALSYDLTAERIKNVLLQKQALEERRKSAIECMEGGKQLAALSYDLTAERIKNSKKEESFKMEIESERRARVRNEELLKQEKIMTKRLKTQTEYYRSRLNRELERRGVSVPSEKNSKSMLDQLCDRIEEAFGVMKGAHNETKAAQLLEMLSGGLLFNGTGVTIIESMNRDFVKGLFHRILHCKD